MLKVCTKCLGGHKCANIAIFDDFGGVVTIATADTPKVKLRVCVKVKCESFESCEKCAQNVWGGTKAQKHQFLTILGVWLPQQRQIPPNSIYECLANSNVNRLRHVKTRWACEKCAHML